MRTQLDCIPCFIRQSLDALRRISSDEITIQKAIKRVLKEVSEFDLSLSPPEMGQVIHNIIREESGNSDPYYDIKKLSNKRALELYSDIKNKIIASKDPFISAIRFAIAGNIMDFAILLSWDRDRIEDSFSKAENQPIDMKVAEELRQDIKKAKTILLLADNAGESVFDKLLIEHLLTNAKVYYAAKDSPIINDATVEDAIAVGLDRVASVVSNGTNAPGTLLHKCSPEFLDIFNSADVVIAKGQANFETLNQEKRSVYFLTQIKCNVLAQRYSYSLGDWIITNTDNIRKHDEGII